MDLIDPMTLVDVTPALQHAVWRRCTAVPGLAPLSIEVAPPTDAGQRTIAIDLKGWSPTLHECTMRIVGKVDPTSPTYVDDAIAIVEKLVVDQQARADRAMTLGIGMPADTNAAWAVRSHLHADASHLALMLRLMTDMARQDGGSDGDPDDDALNVEWTLREAGNTIRIAHAAEKTYGTGAYAGGNAISNDGMTAFSRESADGTTMACVGLTPRGVRTGDDRLTLQTMENGSNALLTIGRKMPNTMVTAMNGRRLDEIFDMTPWERSVLGSRTVSEAQEAEDMLVLTLDPLDVAMREIEGMTPRNAMTHLLECMTMQTR